MSKFKSFMKSGYMIFFMLVCYPLWVLIMKDGLEGFGYTLMDFWWYIILVPVGCFIALYLIIGMAERLSKVGSQNCSKEKGQ